MKKKAKIGDIDIVIGKNLKFIRIKQGVTQEQLGTVLGVSFQQIQKYEQGKNRISAGALQQIAMELNEPLENFFVESKDSDAWHPSSQNKEFIEMASLFQKIGNEKIKKNIKRLLSKLAESKKSSDDVAESSSNKPKTRASAKAVSEKDHLCQKDG